MLVPSVLYLCPCSSVLHARTCTSGCQLAGGPEDEGHHAPSSDVCVCRTNAWTCMLLNLAAAFSKRSVHVQLPWPSSWHPEWMEMRACACILLFTYHDGMAGIGPGTCGTCVSTPEASIATTTTRTGGIVWTGVGPVLRLYVAQEASSSSTLPSGVPSRFKATRYCFRLRAG
jgi:hypothetical protein